MIAERLGPTVLLIITGEVAGIILGCVLGLIGAWERKTAIDAVALTLGLGAWALPAFWLGIIFLILARGHLPMGGYATLGVTYHSVFAKWLDVGRHLALPAFTLAVMLFGSYMLIARNSSLEVLAEDYILTAKAKGLSPLRVRKDHEAAGNPGPGGRIWLGEDDHWPMHPGADRTFGGAGASGRRGCAGPGA